MPNTMMKCGCVAQGTNDTRGGIPWCIIHDCGEVAENLPNLEGRTARCGYYGGKCKSERPSAFNLAFFQHCPDKEFDSYYCGCYGWD